MKQKVHLNIETIVLRDMGKIDRQSFEQGLRQALTEKFGEQLMSVHSQLSIQTDIAIIPGENSQQLGKHLGKSLATAITGSRQTEGGKKNV